MLDGYFYYDTTSASCLRWKVGRPGGVKAGDQAGWLDTGGYYMVTCLRKQYMVARIIWELQTGASPGSDEVDHFDGNAANNLFGNLRLVSHAINSKNRKKRSDNKSGHVGVSKQTSGKDRWYIAAQCNLNGKTVRKRWPVTGRVEADVVAEAAAWRASQLEAMRAEGYTERHINGN